MLQIESTLYKGKKEDAEMTTNWSKVVNLARIKEGAMCVFTFYNGRHGVISSVVCLNRGK